MELFVGGKDPLGFKVTRVTFDDDDEDVDAANVAHCAEDDGAAARDGSSK